MYPKTLSVIKKAIRKVHQVYDILIEEWNGDLEHGNDATYPITVIVGVILQNMAFDASNCYSYDRDRTVKELYSRLDTLRSLNEYSNKCYMTHFPFTECDSIITGFVMSEDASNHD